MQRAVKRWRARRLGPDYLYAWVDGVYPKAGPVDERTALVVVVELNRKGAKELLAIEGGPRESGDSWRDLLYAVVDLRQLKRRGVHWIGLVIADGINANWKALHDVFPQAHQQRCWIHKMRPALAGDKVPQSAHDEVKNTLDAIYRATSREKALRAKSRFIPLIASGPPWGLVASLEVAGDRLFIYYSFQSLHWKSIKSTNVVESNFATVKLRTDATRRIRNQESATYLVFSEGVLWTSYSSRQSADSIASEDIDWFQKQLIRAKRN